MSGESGAGKTETTKLIIEHILSRAGTSNTTLNDRISQMSPVLEAFGNAQTVMNHNSSRFGKYLEISFTSSGGVAGGTLSDYLLERSRVVSHARGERSFHVFYYLAAGLEPAKKETYRVGPALSFQYLKMNDSSVDVAKNTAMWKEMTVRHYSERLPHSAGCHFRFEPRLAPRCGPSCSQYCATYSTLPFSPSRIRTL